MPYTPIKTINGRVVGVLKGNTFYKRVRSSVHLYRKIGDNGSWGIDYDILNRKLPERCSVYITDHDTDTLYIAPKGFWKEYGTIKHFKDAGEDHGAQVFLPVEYFTKVKQSPPKR